MVFDYSVYVVAILTVLILGISKGGFGGGLGMIATPFKLYMLPLRLHRTI